MNPHTTILSADTFYIWLDDVIEDSDAPQHVTYEELREQVLAAVLWSVDVAGNA